MSIALLRAKLAARKKEASHQAPKPAPQAAQVAAAVAAVLDKKVHGALPVSHTNHDGQLDKNQVTIADFNPDQKLAVNLAISKKSFCLIGGAGSGKTTTTKGIVQELFASGAIGKLTSGTEKLFKEGNPSVALLSFTNQAVRNIASALPKDFRSSCSTFHNAVEYHPDYFDVEVLDEHGQWTGDYRQSMRFIPRYGMEGSKVTNLPDSASTESCVDWQVQMGDVAGCGEILPHLDVVIVEEGGSVPRPLFYTFVSALPRPKDTIFIFLGDLNQMPPVFDDAILGFMLLALPVVELQVTYRNVGLVKKVAQRILTGKPIRDNEATKDHSEGGLSGTDKSGTVTFKPFAKHVDWEIATPSLGKHLRDMVVEGNWDENESVVIVPQNVKLGQVELNKWIAQGITTRDDLEVYHVTYNGQNRYLCIGDKVLYNKRYHRITEILPNPDYSGKKPLPPSKYVNRWGTIDREFEKELLGGMTRKQYEDSIDVDQFLDNFEGAELAKGQQSSAIVKMVLDKVELDEDQLVVLEKYPDRTFGETTAKGAGDMSKLLHVYAMTPHKAQGSEWQNVLVILHRSHGKMLTRELLYTSITRARTNLTVWYSGENPALAGASALCRGILNQEIKGKTLEEKLEYFRNKLRVEAFRDLVSKRDIE